MAALLHAHEHACFFVIRWLLWLCVLVDDHRRRTSRRARHWQRRLRRIYERWLVCRGHNRPAPFTRDRRPWNRTPDHVEVEVVRLHVEQPHLGAGQLRWLAARVLGFSAARETIRQILIRRRDLVAALEDQHRRRPRRIHVGRRRQLWGADLTIVWVLGILPVWLLGIVDYRGSRIVCFARIRLWPTAAQIAAAFARTVAEHGAPARLLTDRAPIFRAAAVAELLASHGTRHVLIKPCHAWTNGRIERIFRTFKETVFRHCGLWLLKSHAQVDRFCTDFVVFHNRDRPHSAYAGRTPDEVYFGRPAAAPTGRVSYFDGRVLWYRFG